MTLQDVIDKISDFWKWSIETFNELMALISFEKDWFDSHIVLVIIASGFLLYFSYALLWFLFQVSRVFLQWLLHLKRYFTDKKYKAEYEERIKREKTERETRND